MLACKLALRWGILDVQAWLSSLPAGALDFWMAFDQLQPIGDEWLQTALVAQQASFGAFAQAGVDVPELESFMPARYKPKKRKPQSETRSQNDFDVLLRMTQLDKVANG
jgi:hypothetical protein